MALTNPYIIEEDFVPGYIALYHSGELARRVEEAIASLESCKNCPRCCGTNRLRGFVGTCMTKRHAQVCGYFPRMGEEVYLVGQHGSGTILFAHCGLKCVFCQKGDPNQDPKGQEVTAQELADIMLELQDTGCHNINLNTPDHVVPQILEALLLAVEGGLHLPLVYNTSAYTSMKVLSWLDGVIDIYAPNFKIGDADNAKKYLLAKEYPEVAKAAVTEMYRQVGSLKIGIDGLAKRGVIARHLVMPNGVASTAEVMATLAGISSEMYLNILGKYHPAGKVTDEKYAEINHKITGDDMMQAYLAAHEAGLWRFEYR